MKKQLHHLFSIFFFLFSFITFSQDYQWQWAHRGGGNQNAGSNASWQPQLEQIFDVKIDQHNNYYFAGTITNYNPQFMGESITKYGTNNIDTDIYIVSTDCEGNFRWHTTIGGHVGESYVSMDLDNLGGLYISFTTINSSRSNNTNVPPHYAPGVALGYGASGANPNPNNRRIALIKYDTDGNYLWHIMPQDENVTVSYNPGFFEARGFGYSLITESDGTIHWHCGFLPGNHLNGQLVVPEDVSEYHAILKYDKDGNYLSHIPLPFTGGAGFIQTKLYRDPLNERYYFYITAVNSNGLEPTTWEGETLNTAGAVYALDAAGNELWRKVASSPSLRSASIWGLTTDEFSNVYLTGLASNNTVNSQYASLAGYTFTHFSSSPYLMKLDQDGNLLWGTNLNPSVESTDLNECNSCFGRSIAINDDEVAITGSLQSNAWGTISMPRAYGDGPAPVLVRFNKETGEPIAMNDIKDVLGVNTSEELMTVATDLNGNYVVGGYARSTIFVNHPTIAPLTTNGGYSDFFIAKLGTGPCEPLSIDELVKNKVKLYPNPTGGMLYIEAENLRSYAVYNLLGQELMKGEFNNSNNLNINLEGLSRGTYLVRLIGLDGVVITEKIIRD